MRAQVRPWKWPERESGTQSQALCPFPRRLKTGKTCPLALPSPPLPAAGNCHRLQRILHYLMEGLASSLQPGLCPRLWDKRPKRQGWDEALETPEERWAKSLALLGNLILMSSLPGISLGPPESTRGWDSCTSWSGQSWHPAEAPAEREGSGGCSPRWTVEHGQRQEHWTRSQPGSPA